MIDRATGGAKAIGRVLHFVQRLQLIELGTFFAAMIALIVRGCIFTRMPSLQLGG